MANAPVQMLPEFPAWYASVSFGKSDAAAARWTGVVEATKAATPGDIEVLVRIAFKTKQPPSSEGAEKFAKAIVAADNTFDAATAARETQVLAASALMHLIRTNVYAALAVTAAAVDSGRHPQLPMDLVGASEHAIRAIAESSRRRILLGEFAPPDVKWAVTPEEAGQKQPRELVEDLRAVIQQAFKVAAERQNRILSAYRHQMSISDEELQMLWWLTGNSTADGTAFEDIETDARPFILGRELAGRTVSPPGPGSVRGLLSRTGLKDVGKITIPNAVNAMSDNWSKGALGERDVSPVTLPLHNALYRRNETGAGENWIMNWASVTEVAPTHAVTPLRLAELFYRERLLLAASG